MRPTETGTETGTEAETVAATVAETGTEAEKETANGYGRTSRYPPVAPR